MLLHRPASIERLFSEWAARSPSFLWAPTERGTFTLDRVTRLQGRVVGQVPVVAGGLSYVAPNSSDSWIEFPTNAGISSGFIGMMLVSCVNPAAITGTFVKVGSGVNGVGWGCGNTTVEDTGSKGVILLEQVSWHPGNSNFLAAGFNLINFGFTSDSIVALQSMTTGVDCSINSLFGHAPSARLSINGYMASRGSNVTVHAVGMWPKSLSSSGAFQAERALLAAPATRMLQGMPQRDINRAFTPRSIWVPVAGVGGGQTFFKSITGSLTAAAVAQKFTKAPAKAGTVTMIGALSDRFVLQRASAGTLQTSGGLRKSTRRALAGSLLAAGSLRRKVAHHLTGAVLASGALRRKVGRKIAGSVVPSGSLLATYKTLKSAAGSITASGSLTRTYLTYVPSLAGGAAKALYSMLTRR